MARFVTIKQASEITGLSYCEIRRGINNKIYPHIKVGCGRGKFMLDIDALNMTINRLVNESIGVR